MSDLRDRQSHMMYCVMVLLDEIFQRGYECTGGDLMRDKRVFGVVGESKGYGAPSSNHKQRLAIDINLFKDGVYLTDEEHHKQFGEYWESLDERNRWGGRYQDPNHYETLPHGTRNKQ